MGCWSKVTLHYDCELLSNNPESSHELQTSLKNCGLYNLASLSMKNENLDTMYECAWRLSNWDSLNEPKSEVDTLNEYEKYHYLALKAFHENDSMSINQAIAHARKLVIQSLSHASLESSKNLYRPLTQLQSLQEIENFVEAQNDFSVTDLLDKLKKYVEINRNEFIYVEPIQAQRITILKDLLCKTNDDNLRTFLAETFLQLAQIARTDCFNNVAQIALNNLEQMKGLKSSIKGRISFEQAQLLWVDDKLYGRYLLRHILENTKIKELQAAALTLYGSWMVETRSENAQNIINNYFLKAIEILSENELMEDNFKLRCQTLDALARFADSQYKQVSFFDL